MGKCGNEDHIAAFFVLCASGMNIKKASDRNRRPVLTSETTKRSFLRSNEFIRLHYMPRCMMHFVQ
jgi:hypothetical protein